MRSQDSSLYQRAKNFLMRRTNYETFKSIPYDQMAQSLDRIRGFLNFLGSPDKRYAIVHVAGTKGKGTVCGALDQIYRAAGYRVGLFTSPHLEEIVERFQINGRNCDKNLFAETTCALAERWKEYAALEKKRAAEKCAADEPAAHVQTAAAPCAPPTSLFDPEFTNPAHADSAAPADAPAAAEDPDLVQPLTFFEWTLVIAATLFARAKVDIAIFEVGMGGRFDSTNVCDADVSVLTSISFDHCEQLGNTLEAIAAEKLGIVKTNAPLVVGLGYSASLYDGLDDYNARRDALVKRLAPVEPFAASGRVFDLDPDPQTSAELSGDPDSDTDAPAADDCASSDVANTADCPLSSCDPGAVGVTTFATPDPAEESADETPAWLPGVSGVPGVSDSGLCPVAPLFVVGDGIAVRDFAYAVDPQTEITRESLDRLRDLARARAGEFRAPFYSVEAVSRRVASLKAPNLDSVRRWNFEIALRVVDVLANRQCAPDRRPGAGDPEKTRRYPVSDAAIAVAAANFALPARFELVSRSPLIVVDGAHNRASVASLMRSVAERFPRKRVRALLATTLGKDIRGMLAELLACADEVHLSERSRDDRALALPDLIQIAEKLLDETCPEDSPIRRKLHVVPDFRAFLADYSARPNLEESVLVVLGSFYFAAEVRKIVRAR